jgi:hypothetical protein
LLNKTSLALTAGVLLAEVGYLTYKRFAAKERMDPDTYLHRMKASILSNAAGFVGSGLGAGIGCFLGNLICPGVGGFVGSLIGSLVVGASASMAVDYAMDKKAYSVENFKEAEVTEEQKLKSYIMACDILQVPPKATKKFILERARAKFKDFHPDKNMSAS